MVKFALVPLVNEYGETSTALTLMGDCWESVTTTTKSYHDYFRLTSTNQRYCLLYQYMQQINGYLLWQIRKSLTEAAKATGKTKSDTRRWKWSKGCRAWDIAMDMIWTPRWLSRSREINIFTVWVLMLLCLATI